MRTIAKRSQAMMIVALMRRGMCFTPRVTSDLSFLSTGIRTTTLAPSISWFDGNNLTPSKSRRPESLLFSSTTSSQISKEDYEFMELALEAALNGKGHTFPNPAVGCVLVADGEQILGTGFHPRSGFPHAEVFALLEAAGHTESGLESAKAVMEYAEHDPDSNDPTWAAIQNLSSQYASGKECDEEGPQDALFGGIFKDGPPVTAYVTLEPCCHYGKTPPCALSLVAAGVSRVVVGVRDPNPRVNGGGVTMLQDAGIQVEVVRPNSNMGKKCTALVANFFKRITPEPSRKDYSWIIGSGRRVLRKDAANQKRDGVMNVVSWTSSAKVNVKTNTDDSDSDEDIAAAIDAVPLSPSWMEHIDAVLWDHELVQLKLSAATPKKKWAKMLGERIGKALDAHVAQTVGHSVLLYRPGDPPVIDLSKGDPEE